MQKHRPGLEVSANLLLGCHLALVDLKHNVELATEHLLCTITSFSSSESEERLQV